MGVIGPIIFFIVKAIWAYLEYGDDSGIKFWGSIITVFFILAFFGKIFA